MADPSNLEAWKERVHAFCSAVVPSSVPILVPVPPPARGSDPADTVTSVRVVRRSRYEEEGPGTLRTSIYRGLSYGQNVLIMRAARDFHRGLLFELFNLWGGFGGPVGIELRIGLSGLIGRAVNIAANRRSAWNSESFRRAVADWQRNVRLVAVRLRVAGEDWNTPRAELADMTLAVVEWLSDRTIDRSRRGSGEWPEDAEARNCAVAFREAAIARRDRAVWRAEIAYWATTGKQGFPPADWHRVTAQGFLTNDRRILSLYLPLTYFHPDFRSTAVLSLARQYEDGHPVGPQLADVLEEAGYHDVPDSPAAYYVDWLAVLRSGFRRSGLSLIRALLGGTSVADKLFPDPPRDPGQTGHAYVQGFPHWGHDESIGWDVPVGHTRDPGPVDGWTVTTTGSEHGRVDFS